MKKFLASALMLLAASTATYAQHAEGTISLIPRAGITVANQTKASDNAESNDWKVGFVGGVDLEYQVTDIFSLTGGVFYSMQGHKHDTPIGTLTTKTDYINIPILANVYVVKGLAVKAGIQPGFNVSSSYKVDGKNYYADPVDPKTFDFSIPVGLSYEFSGVPIVLDARYNWGLTKVWKDTDSRNSVFQFTVGYKFDL